LNKILNVGLIGFGLAGKVLHAPLIAALPGLHLKRIVERSGAEAKSKYPWIEADPDSQGILNDPEIDLVVIATPNEFHYCLAKQALERGKHVVIEKPFTITTAEADDLIRIAKERQRVLSVYHNRRWDGDFLTIQELLNHNLLGSVVEWEANWDRHLPEVNLQKWREKDEPGAGILYDLGVHFIDQVLILFGMPSSVYADVRIMREGGTVNDYFEVVLGYDRFKASLRSTKLAAIARPRYVIHGTKGTYVKHGIDTQEASLRAGISPAHADWGKEKPEQWGTLRTELNGLVFSGSVETKQGAYLDFYRNIRDAIHGEAEVLVKPEQARDAIHILELCEESSKRGYAVSYGR
jgi:scyllo-inositol 2-dehydrogenase (NADP+)